jgi:hypothetical protein
MYEYGGTANGKHIDLDEALPFETGTRVRIQVSADVTNGPPPGSPESVLSLVGTLSDQEADSIMQVSQELRRVDPELWSDQP